MAIVVNLEVGEGPFLPKRRIDSAGQALAMGWDPPNAVIRTVWVGGGACTRSGSAGSVCELWLPSATSCRVGGRLLVGHAGLPEGTMPVQCPGSRVWTRRLACGLQLVLARRQCPRWVGIGGEAPCSRLHSVDMSQAGQLRPFRMGCECQRQSDCRVAAPESIRRNRRGRLLGLLRVSRFV